MLKLRDFRFYNAGEGGGSGTPSDNSGGQVPPTPAPTGGQPGDPALPSEKPLDSEALKRELAEARKEAAKYRTERNAFETDLKKRQEAEMTEAEKLKAQATDATEKLSAMEKRVIRSEVKVAAQQAGIVDPELAYLAIADKIEVKDGEPTNIVALLTDLLAQKPYLAGTVRDGGAGNPPRPALPSIEAIKKMTPQQIAALPDAEYQRIKSALQER